MGSARWHTIELKTMGKWSLCHAKRTMIGDTKPLSTYVYRDINRRDLYLTPTAYQLCQHF